MWPDYCGWLFSCGHGKFSTQSTFPTLLTTFFAGSPWLSTTHWVSKKNHKQLHFGTAVYFALCCLNRIRFARCSGVISLLKFWSMYIHFYPDKLCLWFAPLSTDKGAKVQKKIVFKQPYSDLLVLVWSGYIHLWCCCWLYLEIYINSICCV